MIEETHITISQAAEMIGCTTAHLRLMAKRNELRAEKIGSVWLVEKSHAEEIAKQPYTFGRPRSRKKD